MTNTHPLVSVIITTYYRNKLLREAINSVINQTYEPIEIIVVDDSGEEIAKEVVNEYDVTYLPKSKNEGQIAAWNAGISHCHGDFVQFLDDDDQLLETKIEKQVQKFRSTSNVGVVYSGMKWESGGEKMPDKDLRGNVLQQLLVLDTSPCVTSTILIRREFVEEIHPIPQYPAATDEVLKIELAQRTEFDYVYEPLIIRGDRQNRVTNSMKKVEAKWLIINNYNELYEQFPDRVLKAAISSTYFSKSRIYFNKSQFSIKARLFLLYSLYMSPNKNKRETMRVLLRALGGKNVVRFAGKVEDKIKQLNLT